ncbi:hypothetical protein N7G274_008084 [Stereocaulon virgatum]|uniref:Uncharacterized protein n=1 Tax=Stereocaulon virgatum TaxID=373712 RepID=A0ABR3ZZH9_9LECA
MDPTVAFCIMAGLWQDLFQMQTLYAQCGQDALTTYLLNYQDGAVADQEQLLTALGNWVYGQGIIGQDTLPQTSWVLKAVHPSNASTMQIDACLLIEWIAPDPYWHVPWSRQPGTAMALPDCVNPVSYQEIENVGQSNRKMKMRGKGHYCKQKLRQGFQVTNNVHRYQDPKRALYAERNFRRW